MNATWTGKAMGTTAAPRMRILLSAFACDPVTGSEPYVGWNWATRIAARHDLTVLTRTYSARLIGQNAPAPGFALIHFDLPGCADKDHYWRWIKPYYVLWQFCALFVVLGHHLRRRFALIHHLTYNVVDMPGFLALVPGCRFVWGPVGGGQVPPPQLRGVYGPAWGKQRLRAVAKRLARYNPLVVLSAWRAYHVFFANRETAALVSRYCRAWSVMLETAIDPPPLVSPRAREGTVRLLWLGNAIDRKALIIAIEAMGRVCAGHEGLAIELCVAGDGPMLAQARQRAAELNLHERVRFLGKVAFEAVMEIVEDSDAFLFTSVQDTSGNVVLEAMSRGKPVICLDHQGAAEVVTDDCGVKVPVADMDAVVGGFAAAIFRLASDPEETEAMGARAWRRIMDHHRWESRLRAYEAVIAGAMGSEAGGRVEARQ